jgi:rhodanese-related sulfurtransferase
MTSGQDILSRIRKQAGGLLLIAVVPALLTAAFHPRRPVWSRDLAVLPEVTWSEAAGWRGLVLFVDARTEAAYEHAHIPGAISLNVARWEEQLPALIKAWRPGMRMVVYCDDHRCDESQAVARRLRRDMGVNAVFVLKGGWGAWLEAHRPGQ